MSCVGNIPVWFQEINVYPEDEHARDIVRKLRDNILGITGLPGPV